MADVVVTQLEVRGDEAYLRAAERVEALEREHRSLNDLISRGAPGWEMARRRVGEISVELDKARAAYARFSAATTTTNVGGFAQQGMAIDKVSTATQRYIAQAGAIGPAMQKGASSGSMALLVLGQTIEDAQYGFQAIANQLPQLGMLAAQSFGMGTAAAMKFGGAVAIMATATNINLKRHEEWREILKGTTLDLDQMEASARGVATAITGWDFSGAEKQAKEAAKKAEETRIEAGTRGRSAVEGVRTPEDAARAEDFRKALQGEQGGGEGFRERLLASRMSGFSKEQLDEKSTLPGVGQVARRDLIQRTVDEELDRAMRGDAGAVRNVSASAPELGNRMSLLRSTRSREELNEQGSIRLRSLRDRQAQGMYAAPGEGITAAAEASRKDMTNAQVKHAESARDVVRAYEEFEKQVRLFGVTTEQAQAAYNEYNRSLRVEVELRREAVRSAAVAERGEAAKGRMAGRAMSAEERRQVEGAERAARDFGESGMGEQLARAMYDARRRGEDPAEVEARLREQVGGKLSAAGLDDATRVRATESIMSGAQGQVEDAESRMAMRRAAFGPLADPNVRFRAAQAGEFGRAGIAATQQGRMAMLGQQMSERFRSMRQRGMEQQQRRFGRYVDPASVDRSTSAPAPSNDPARNIAEGGEAIKEGGELISQAVRDLANRGVRVTI